MYLNTGNYFVFTNVLSTPRASGKAAVIGNYAIVAGGVNASNVNLAALDVLVRSFSSRFSSAARMAALIHAHTCTSHNLSL
jgi:hypothetical protein